MVYPADAAHTSYPFRFDLQSYLQYLRQKLRRWMKIAILKCPLVALDLQVTMDCNCRLRYSNL